MIVLTVLYPKSAESRFDMAYYVETHMGLVKRLWGAYGLGAIRVLQGADTLDGSMPKYEAMALLEFASEPDLHRALEAHGAEVMADVANFTDIGAVLQVNAVTM